MSVSVGQTATFLLHRDIRKRRSKFTENNFWSSVSRGERESERERERGKKCPGKTRSFRHFETRRGGFLHSQKISPHDPHHFGRKQSGARVFPHSQMIQCNGRFDRNHPELVFVRAVRSNPNSLSDLNVFVHCMDPVIFFFFLFLRICFRNKVLQRVSVAVNCCMCPAVCVLGSSRGFCSRFVEWS